MAYPAISAQLPASGAGLLGLGGLGASMPAMPQGLMKGFYDPQEARRLKIRNILLGTGLDLLSQGPSDKPINFGTSLGNALNNGFGMAQQEDQNYRDMAMKGYEMKRVADNEADNRNWRQKQFEYGVGRDKVQDARQGRIDGINERNSNMEFQDRMERRKSIDAWVATLSPADQLAARANPDKFAQQFLESEFNTQSGGANGIYGNVYWGPDGRPYGLNKDGSGMKILPIEGGGTVLDPATMAGDKANKTAVGKGRGEAQATFESMTSKMPGLENVVMQLEQLADTATYSYAGQGRDWIASQSGYGSTEGATARKRYMSMVDNQILPMLRDTFGSQFTEKEGQTLRSTLGDPNVPPESKKAVLSSFIEQKRRDIEALAVQSGQRTATPPPNGTVLRYNPETGDFE